VVVQYISTDEKIVDILVKPLSKMDKVCVLKKQPGARGYDFLEEITLRLGGNTDVLLIYGQ
jgi:hypothetical protein